MSSAAKTYTSPLGLYVIVVAEQPHKLISTFKNTCLELSFSVKKLFSGVFWMKFRWVFSVSCKLCKFIFMVFILLSMYPQKFAYSYFN